MITRYPPADPRDAVPVATFLAGRYGAKLAAFEIWNEPDQANERTSPGPTRSGATPRWRTLYRPLKQANPQLKVLAGAFVGYNGNLLRALYRAGIKGNYDALSVHFYDLTLWGCAPGPRRAAQHHDAKPIWIAEIGLDELPSGRGGDRRPPLRHRGRPGALPRRSRPRRLRADLCPGARGLRSRGRGRHLRLRAGRPERRAEARGGGGAQGPRPGARTAPRARPQADAPAAGRVVASGSGPAGDQFELRVAQGGALRYVRSFRLDIEGRFRLQLPRALGSRGLTVRLYAPFVDRQVTRHS